MCTVTAHHPSRVKTTKSWLEPCPVCVQHLLLLLGIQLKQVLRWDKRFLCPNGSAYHFWPKTEVVHSWDTGDVTEEPLTAGVLTFFLAL